jgi:UDP-3-O-acyl N-acetylglucosamine deacetylase
MQHRTQRTIAREVEVSGIGFLTGADVRLRFRPAPAGHGITFLRTDCLDAVPVPALVEFTVPRERRTAIEYRGVAIEMIEHVMAALAGLRVDNCAVELDAPEPPGCDGSSLQFAEALCDAGFVDLGEARRRLVIRHDVSISSENRGQSIRATRDPCSLTLGYSLNYGPSSPIAAQQVCFEITPEVFLSELAFSRTFILEDEVASLRALGYGRRTTPRDLLIFGAEGVIDNALRADDECARHKTLDCLGDFALIGCDLVGAIHASRSGHRLNAELVRRIKLAHADEFLPSMAKNAA